MATAKQTQAAQGQQEAAGLPGRSRMGRDELTRALGED